MCKDVVVATRWLHPRTAGQPNPWLQSALESQGAGLVAVCRTGYADNAQDHAGPGVGPMWEAQEVTDGGLDGRWMCALVYNHFSGPGNSPVNGPPPTLLRRGCNQHVPQHISLFSIIGLWFALPLPIFRPLGAANYVLVVFCAWLTVGWSDWNHTAYTMAEDADLL